MKFIAVFQEDLYKMGLTNQSTGAGVLERDLKVERILADEKVISLAGNPNVGKSTVFNSLTGLNQHTGNWPGKTVTHAQGRFCHRGKGFIVVDIPGTYSLMANSVEEEVARDFICFGNPDATVLVTDATCIERNLNLVIQTLEITSKVVVCVNLLDEAERKGIRIDIAKLEGLLGVPVVGTSAKSGIGLNELMDAIYDMAFGEIDTSPTKIVYDDAIERAVSLVEREIERILGDRLNSRWVSLKLLDGDAVLLKALHKYLGFDLTCDESLAENLNKAKKAMADAGITDSLYRDKVVSKIVHTAEDIAGRVVSFEREGYDSFDRKIDSILTSKTFGIPIMAGLLAFVLWLTIVGANYPSQCISTFLFWVEDHLVEFFLQAGAPAWVPGVLITGVYRTVAWVVSVMLPPMAIFFPLFTLMEDLGYLPRIAFNLDNFFKKACAHGKQALTMCMGFGCNAAGIIGCRIIDSPRERLIAVITNSFVPCNGRFPTLIAIITMFFAQTVAGPFQSVLSTLILTSVIVFGILMTLIVSRILSKTVLKGLPSSFTLELPPYRKPQIGKVILRSVFDRTLFVLGRAVSVAAPAGLVLWILANTYAGELSLLAHCAGFLDPFARLLGLDGYILMAFILGFPANEIVIPIILMCYMSTGTLTEFESLYQLKTLLVSNGWTWVTAVCVMLFSLMHWPCGTTCLTIRKECQSLKWTLVSFAVPAVTGIAVCLIISNTARFLGLA